MKAIAAQEVAFGVAYIPPRDKHVRRTRHAIAWNLADNAANAAAPRPCDRACGNCRTWKPLAVEGAVVGRCGEPRSAVRAYLNRHAAACVFFVPQ